MLNDEEDGVYRSEENTSCVSSWMWSFLLDPMTGGTCAGGTAGSVACSTGASCNTTFAVGIGFWAGVPALFCSVLGCYKACSGDTTQTPPPMGTSLFVNKLPALVSRCCNGSEESTGPAARLTSPASPRQSSSTPFLLSSRATPSYDSTSRGSLLTSTRSS